VENNHPIIESANELSNTTGVIATTNPEIADKAGITGPLIYNQHCTEISRTVPDDMFVVPVPDRDRGEEPEIRFFKKG
jgi:hypothetical protein